MSYCRFCGTEISYKRTKNDKWMPCNLLTGEPHFCTADGKENSSSGLEQCKYCGKAVIPIGKAPPVDYATLLPHVCRKGDVTRFRKFTEKEQLLKKAGLKKDNVTINSEDKVLKKRLSKKTAPGSKVKGKNKKKN